MDDVSAGLSLANQAVSTLKNVVGLAKEAKSAVKGSDPVASEKLDDLREAVNSVMDQLIELKAEHLELIEKNVQMKQAEDLKRNYELKQVSTVGQAYVYVPRVFKEGLENVMFCPLCFDAGSLSPLNVNSDSVAVCQASSCKFVARLHSPKPVNVNTRRGRGNSWLGT